MPDKKIPIACAHGDGIGPEIMDATLSILNESGASLDIRTVEIGEKVYKSGIVTGMKPEAWDVIRDSKAFLNRGESLQKLDFFLDGLELVIRRSDEWYIADEYLGVPFRHKKVHRHRIINYFSFTIRGAAGCRSLHVRHQARLRY